MLLPADSLANVVVLQVAAAEGLRIDPAWTLAAVGTIGTTLTTTIAVLYRGQIGALRERITWLEGELAKRDVREDRLIDQIGRVADAADKTVSYAERERARR